MMTLSPAPARTPLPPTRRIFAGRATCLALLALHLCFISACAAGPSGNAPASEAPRGQDDFYRGTFVHHGETYALSFSHAPIDPRDHAQSIAIRAGLEPGCQLYSAQGTYHQGTLMALLRSTYLAGGSEGLKHFDLLALRCPIDERGQVASAHVTLPDGTTYELR